MMVLLIIFRNKEDKVSVGNIISDIGNQITISIKQKIRIIGNSYWTGVVFYDCCSTSHEYEVLECDPNCNRKLILKFKQELINLLPKIIGMIERYTPILLITDVPFLPPSWGPITLVDTPYEIHAAWLRKDAGMTSHEIKVLRSILAKLFIKEHTIIDLVMITYSSPFININYLIDIIKKRLNKFKNLRIKEIMSGYLVYSVK